MKKFALLTIGFTQPTSKIMEQWMQWFKSIEDIIVEQVGLIDGKEVTQMGTNNQPMDENAVTGYLVINIENINEATRIAEKCPMVTSTKVYEVRSR